MQLQKNNLLRLRYIYFLKAEKLKEISESAVISLLDVNNDDVSLALKLASSLSSSDYNHFLRTASIFHASNIHICNLT